MFVGVDIGGTNTKIGIVSKLGRVVAMSSFKTRSPREPQDFVKEIFANIEKLLHANDIQLENIEGIGVGVPGVVDNNGVVVNATNLKWKDVELKEIFKEYTTSKIVIGNDADCAMLAEWKFGGAKGAKNAILITLGTGIGSGIILDNKLYRGAHGTGSECGHMVIKFDGEMCSCGNRGCWEVYASAKALTRRTEQAVMQNPNGVLSKIVSQYGRASAHSCFEGARRGDSVSQNLMNEYIDYVVCGLINLTQIFHPEMFILGGGVAKEGLNFVKAVDAKLNDFLKKNNFEPTVLVKRPVLENNAGIVGAASLAMDV
ncbi:MAG: ROK family protein [Clostridiales bacterium]|nr:ROK family protein [Clostridiales bacterium]